MMNDESYWPRAFNLGNRSIQALSTIEVRILYICVDSSMSGAASGFIAGSANAISRNQNLDSFDSFSRYRRLCNEVAFRLTGLRFFEVGSYGRARIEQLPQKPPDHIVGSTEFPAEDNDFAGEREGR
jgi:hypothetical protein